MAVRYIERIWDSYFVMITNTFLNSGDIFPSNKIDTIKDVLIPTLAHRRK